MSSFNDEINKIMEQLRKLKGTMETRRDNTKQNTQNILNKLQKIDIDRLIEIIRKCCQNLRETKERFDASIKETRTVSPELQGEVDDLKKQLNDKINELNKSKDTINKLNEENIYSINNVNELTGIIEEISDIVPTIPDDGDMKAINQKVDDLIAKVNGVKDCDGSSRSESNYGIFGNLFGSPSPTGEETKETETGSTSKIIPGVNVFGSNYGRPGSLVVSTRPTPPPPVNENLRQRLGEIKTETEPSTVEESKETTGGKKTKRRNRKGGGKKQYSLNLTNMMPNIAGSKKRKIKSKKMAVRTDITNNYAIAGKRQMMNFSGDSSYLAGGAKHSRKIKKRKTSNKRRKTTTKKRKIMRKRKI